MATLLKNSADKSSDDDKLMDLFQNRNELKQEFAKLRNEKYRLQDRLKQQDGVIARLQQKLEHIEELLVDPEWARNIMTYYQLRGMGQRCQRKLARFAEQLKQQREQKIMDQALADWRQGLEQEIGALEAQIADRHSNVIQLEDQLKAANRRREDMGGISRMFKSRSLDSEIEEIGQQIAAIEQEEDALRQKIEEIRGREPPAETEGLDLATKRSINYMILAFAQQLYLQFDDDELVSFVREAGEKSAGAIKYGDKQDCENILERVRRGAEALERGGDFAEILQRRAKLIGERAVYQDDEDAVPAAGTVATLYRIGANGVVTEGDANILGDNYWGIAGVLSR